MSADVQSLANYLDANQKLQRENAELITELRDVLVEILAMPMWVSVGGVEHVARIDIPKELFDRAWSVVEKSE